MCLFHWSIKHVFNFIFQHKCSGEWQPVLLQWGGCPIDCAVGKENIYFFFTLLKKVINRRRRFRAPNLKVAKLKWSSNKHLRHKVKGRAQRLWGKCKHYNINLSLQWSSCAFWQVHYCSGGGGCFGGLVLFFFLSPSAVLFLLILNSKMDCYLYLACCLLCLPCCHELPLSARTHWLADCSP